MIKIVIPGEPVAQGRPRFAKRGNFVQTYDPAKSKDYKAYVRLLATNARLDGTLPPLECALEVEIKAFVAIPKSFSKKKREDIAAGILTPTKKPDCDNIAKIILDAMNGIIYEDDKYITKLYVEKIYSDNPRVEVTINECSSNERLHL